MIVTDPVQNHHVYEKFLKQKNVGGVMSRFLPDAVMVGPNNSRIVGVDAIRASLEQGLPYMEDVNFELIELVVHGDIALERLKFIAVSKLPNGEILETSAISSVVLRRQADGNWQIAIDDPGT